MKTIEIYWDDLTDKKKYEIRKLLNMNDKDNNNWDIVPMAMIDIEEDDED